MFEGDISSAPFISLIYRQHAKYINECLKDDDLSFGLHPLLVKVYHEDMISQEELAEFFHLNESTIARNVKKLEDKKVIERVKDKRKKLIKPTEKGRKLAEKIMDYDEEFDEKFNLTAEEYDNFIKTLRKISDAII